MPAKPILPANMPLTERLTNLVKNLTEEQQQQLLDLLIEWQQNEQRGDHRIPCLIAVDYSTQDRVYHDFIQDLSKGGVFIETREPFAEGQRLSMTFSVSNDQNHFKISGEIIRTDDQGIAVRFSKKLSPYQEEIIKRSVAPKK